MRNQLRVGILNELTGWQESIFPLCGLHLTTAPPIAPKGEQVVQGCRWGFLGEEQLCFSCFPTGVMAQRALAPPAVGGQIRRQMIRQWDSGSPVSVAATAAAAAAGRQPPPLAGGHDASDGTH